MQELALICVASLPNCGLALVQDIKDLSGQFAALHMHPLGCRAFQQGILARGFDDLYKELLLIMRTLIMRHSKKSVQDSGAWQLPPKNEELVPIRLSRTEWQAYKTSYDSVKQAFAVYEAGGPANCNKYVIAIMALLAPLRRLCSGGKHSMSSLTVSVPDLHAHRAPPAAGPAADGPSCPAADDMECAICFETFENPVRTNVCFTFYFCSYCIVSFLLLLWSLDASCSNSIACISPSEQQISASGSSLMCTVQRQSL